MPEDKEVDEILDELKHKAEEEKELRFSDNTEIYEKQEEEEANFELVDEPTDNEEKEAMTVDVTDFGDENQPDDTQKKKKIIIAVVCAIVIIAVIIGVILAAGGKNNEPETTSSTTAAATTTTAPTTQPAVVYRNPLTNESDYNADAIDKRPVGIVVENSPAARPQWGMDDSTKSPDIIIEGEVEGGVTRMLWMYADYNALPNQVGPVRSARPPFIKFSELFDTIFIHWGQSQSKGNYVGADSVFVSDNVDHINQMNFNNKVGLYGRDKSRGGDQEHTGVVYGSKMSAAIEQMGFRTDVNDADFSTFAYNDKDSALSESTCNTLKLTYSSRSGSTVWTYNSEDGLYHSSSYSNNVSRKNLLVLFDTTEYIVKDNYKNGRSETYCNYRLAGGSGKLASHGTVTDIKWSVQNGKLVITDTNGNEVKLNTGKTWIGWASENKGGTAAIS